jgi:hypothetical protein
MPSLRTEYPFVLIGACRCTYKVHYETIEIIYVSDEKRYKKRRFVYTLSLFYVLTDRALHLSLSLLCSH